NEIRCDIAIERLSKSNDSIQDISEDLNFHDPSAFHRAFKKWTGVSPGAYREATLNSTA
ncbi:AraC family transcriptional regulator, partial [Acinetobacter baumannii]|nr:AraC family transcriptional regulator [Acinetobacter baumannii]